MVKASLQTAATMRHAWVQRTWLTIPATVRGTGMRKGAEAN